MPATLTRPAPRPAGQWFGLDGVEIFSTGAHHESEMPWTEEELAGLVANFDRFSTGPNPRVPVVLVLNHLGVDLPVARRARFGRATRIYQRGGKLAGDIRRVPPAIARGILSGYYHAVSIETGIAPPGTPARGQMILAISLLSRDERPAVKGLARIPKPQIDNNRPGVYCSRPIGLNRSLLFSESQPTPKGTTMPTADQTVADAMAPILSDLQTLASSFYIAAGLDAAIVDAWVATWPDLPAGEPAAAAAFSERRPAAKPKPGKAFYDQIRRETQERYAGRNAQSGPTLEERLGMLPARR